MVSELRGVVIFEITAAFMSHDQRSCDEMRSGAKCYKLSCYGGVVTTAR